MTEYKVNQLHVQSLHYAIFGLWLTLVGFMLISLASVLFVLALMGPLAIIIGSGLVIYPLVRSPP